MHMITFIAGLILAIIASSLLYTAVQDFRNVPVGASARMPIIRIVLNSIVLAIAALIMIGSYAGEKYVNPSNMVAYFTSGYVHPEGKSDADCLI